LTSGQAHDRHGQSDNGHQCFMSLAYGAGHNNKQYVYTHRMPFISDTDEK